MIKIISPLAPIAVLAAFLPAGSAGATGAPGTFVTPGAIVAAAPDSDWIAIRPADLLVMDLAPAAPAGATRATARRVVIQLLPAPFSQGWVENIRTLVAARWYDGVAVVRVQDNYVTQWGDPDGEVPGKARPLPAGLRSIPESDYATPFDLSPGTGAPALPSFSVPPALRRGIDSYVHDVKADVPAGRPGQDGQGMTGFSDGWPVALLPSDQHGASAAKGRGAPSRPGPAGSAWPIHCYGMVGVGRNVSPDTGSGAELYAVIGHAPRQLDRNIALVGRVIAGIEHLSSLPRGTAELGFYATPEERTGILSVRLGDAVPDLPRYQYLSTSSATFAAYAEKRANRRDEFYIQPAGGADICNVPVPVRVAPAGKAGGM